MNRQRHAGHTILLVLLMVASQPSTALAQGGFVGGINPGFVQQAGVPQTPASTTALPGGAPSPVTSNPRARVPLAPSTSLVIQSGPILHLPSPLARIGGPPRQTISPRPHRRPIEPAPPSVYLYSATGVNPYVYTTGAVPIVAIESGSQPNRSYTDHTPGAIFVGMRRAEVIRTLGRPSATIYRSTGQETLIFSSVTIILQNGIVALIQ